MTTMRIPFGEYLTPFQRAWALRRLNNMDEISPIPIVVKGTDIFIYYDDTKQPKEYKSIWDDLYEKFGCSVHCV